MASNRKEIRWNDISCYEQRFEGIEGKVISRRLSENWGDYAGFEEIAIAIVSDVDGSYNPPTPENQEILKRFSIECIPPRPASKECRSGDTFKPYSIEEYEFRMGVYVLRRDAEPEAFVGSYTEACVFFLEDLCSRFLSYCYEKDGRIGPDIYIFQQFGPYFPSYETLSIHEKVMIAEHFFEHHNIDLENPTSRCGSFKEKLPTTNPIVESRLAVPKRKPAPKKSRENSFGLKPYKAEENLYTTPVSGIPGLVLVKIEEVNGIYNGIVMGVFEDGNTDNPSRDLTADEKALVNSLGFST